MLNDHIEETARKIKAMARRKREERDRWRQIPLSHLATQEDVKEAGKKLEGFKRLMGLAHKRKQEWLLWAEKSDAAYVTENIEIADATLQYYTLECEQAEVEYRETFREAYYADERRARLANEERARLAPPEQVAEETTTTSRSPVGDGMSVHEAKLRAEKIVRRKGGRWPGVNQLMRMVGCAKGTINKAIDSSTYLKARKAEAETAQAYNRSVRTVPASHLIDEIPADSTEQQKIDVLTEESRLEEARDKRQWAAYNRSTKRTP